MSMFASKWRCSALWVAWVAFALAGCNQIQKDPALNKTASALDTRTHCVGRFLIDLPADFEQTKGSDVDLIYGLGKDFRSVKVQVLRAEGSQPSLDSLVKTRSAELSSQDHLKSASKSMLAMLRRVNDSAVLIRSYDSPDMLNYFKAELFAEKNGSIGVFKDEVHKNERPEDIEDKLLRVAERTSFAPDVNQAGRGTCLGHLLMNAGQDGEILMVSFRAKRWPDVLIQLDMNSMLTKSDGGLLTRWDRNAGALNKLDFQSSTLRRGKVTVGGMPGEELLSKGKDRGHVVRSFTAESLLLKPATFSTPSLAISMNMGGQLDSPEGRDASWTDDEAQAIWGAIVKSLRLRPGAL